MAHHHRPTLKQQNKPFKSRHATKSSLKDQAKGRIVRPSSKNIQSSNAVAQSRLNRRNTAKQTQLRKRQALIAATRIFNGVDGAPRIVAVIPLTHDLSSKDAVNVLAEALDTDAKDCPETGLWRLNANRYKTSLQLCLLPYRDFYAALDACKVADYVLFCLSSVVEVDDWGDLLLRCLQAQGFPEVIAVVTPSHTIDIQAEPLPDRKARNPILKSLLSFMQYFIPSQSRVYDLEDTRSSDAISTLRALCEGKPKDVQWRQGRSWLLSEDVQWEDKDEGTLKITGVVRGIPLSVNRLLHIPNYGDFQQSKMFCVPRNSLRKGSMSMDLELVQIAAPTFDADSLISTNDPDTMANEQTWPTDEEMRITQDADIDEDLPDAKSGTTPKRIKKVPKGTSAYQAAWIIEDEEEEEEEEGGGRGSDMALDEDSEDNEEVQGIDAEDAIPSYEEDKEEHDHKSVGAFNDLDEEEEKIQLQSWRDRAREVEDDMAFPDEVDTPKDIPARQRFQRFRGLRSFRTSPWDPYENLPLDYAKIFQFEDYRRTERAVRRRTEEELENIAQPGSRVTLFLKNVPQDVVKSHNRNFPLALFSLLQHEHKYSVLNFTVQRNTEYSQPVESKDPMILCVGARRFRTNPIYSQHTRGGGKGANNVHKFERFLLPGITSVATTYGPIIFGKQPCMLLKETSDPQEPRLVAMGSFFNAETTRIIAKRIILTGHPFKVHKKTATVRYMFFNLDDVTYFKPIQLHTKYGRTGHIKESLGTHGYFKGHFDAPINQMDTVCMSLYKRVYPKWASLFRLDATPGENNAMEE